MEENQTERTKKHWHHPERDEAGSADNRVRLRTTVTALYIARDEYVSQKVSCEKVSFLLYISEEKPRGQYFTVINVFYSVLGLYHMKQ